MTAARLSATTRPTASHKQICVVASHIERNRKTPYDALRRRARAANTALIIAAPELLAALEQAVRYIVRLTAHKGNMNAAELAAAEKELEQVSRLEILGDGLVIRLRSIWLPPARPSPRRRVRRKQGRRGGEIYLAR